MSCREAGRYTLLKINTKSGYYCTPGRTTESIFKWIQKSANRLIFRLFLFLAIQIYIHKTFSQWIFTTRQKTNTPLQIPVLPKALELIEKYKNNPRSLYSGTIFPLISNQKLNSYLKELADLCGIEKHLTFHLARHTFATTVTLRNGVPIETVSKLLGHKSISTTQIYAKVVENKVGEDMELLKNKLLQKNENPHQKIEAM